MSAVYPANQVKDNRAEVALQAAIKTEAVDGNLKAAIEQYRKIVETGSRAIAAKALVRMGQCYEKLGKGEAQKAYEQVVREYADQPEPVKLARSRLAALSQPAGSANHDAMTVRQVWAGPDEDLIGAPTRDGRYLTLQDWPGENLAVRDLVTGQKLRLTNKDPRTLEFAMLSMPSPDGKEVAYAWYNKDNFYDLRIVGLDGSNPRVLYANPELGYLESSDWTPDGKNILAIFYRKDKGSQLALVSVADGSARVLKSFDQEAPKRARFSPDGRYIAYDLPQQPGSNEYDIFILTVDGGQETPAVQHTANDVVFDWTPDGKRLLFGSNRSGTMGAWWIQVADGKPDGTPELVKPDLGQDVWPMGFTRDGSYFYNVRTGMSDVYIAELDLASGRVLAPPVLATQRFAGSNSKPDWSHDGRQLVFLSQRGPGAWGARAICVRDAETGEVREIPSKLDRVVDVLWFPDSRAVLVVAEHPSGKFGPFRIDVQTGDFERVDLQKPSGWGFAFSPDGKTIYYHRGSSIVARELATGQEKVLYSVDTLSYHFRAGVTLSRDGQQLAFAVSEVKSGSKELKVMRAAGGEARDLLRGVPMSFPGSLAWAPDGQSVLFVKQPNPNDLKTELWLIAVQGGEPRKLDLTAKNMRELRIHPDGRRIAFTSGGDKSEVWAMENFLPVAKATK
jgi:Tol biopolymer transport system component